MHERMWYKYGYIHLCRCLQAYSIHVCMRDGQSSRCRVAQRVVPLRAGRPSFPGSPKRTASHFGLFLVGSGVGGELVEPPKQLQATASPNEAG